MAAATPVEARGEGAFRAFFDAHHGYVTAVSRRLLGGGDELEDVVQEVFLQAHRDLDQLRDAGLVRAWLRTVVVRTARRKLRLRALRRMLFSYDVDTAEFLSHEALSAEDRLVLEVVYLTLDQLPANERLAWALRHIEQCELHEVAASCGCSLATAKR